MENLAKPFQPFTSWMWAAILTTCVGGALFMWIIEHPNTNDTRFVPRHSRNLTPMQMNQLLKETSGFHRKPDSSGEEEHGFFSLDSFKHYYLKYIEQG